MSISDPPRIARIETFPIRLPRDIGGATGTAGSPTVLGTSAGGYRWSSVFPTLYSEFIETALVKVTLDDGLHGWGEAQAPLAPRVACTIIDDLLAPVLRGVPFDGSTSTIEQLWTRQYQTMRVRGQTGGFMMDAISGIDLALWDLAGKLRRKPVARLLAGEAAAERVPAYLSGVAGADPNSRAETASANYQRGFRLFKIFHDSDDATLLANFDAIMSRLGAEGAIAVDALWRLERPGSDALVQRLQERRPYWLECPFPPDEFDLHRDFPLPLAIGESYRTRHEVEPFFRENLVRFVQPDLGRCGITETLRIGLLAAEHGVAVVPHVSIALGPQIAAAVHVAAAMPNCDVCEYNPSVFGPSNLYLTAPLQMDGATYRLPAAPGLGVDIRLDELLNDNLGF